MVSIVPGRGGGLDADGSRGRSATGVPERRLPTVAVFHRRRIKEGHRMDGTGSLVKAAAEGPHECPPVLLAEGAVEQEVARRVHRHQEVENVAQGAQRVLLIRRRLVEDLARAPAPKSTTI